MNFQITPGEQRCKIGTEQEGIRTCQIDVEFATGMETVDRQLKIRAQLNLVYAEYVFPPGLIMLCSIAMEGMILLQSLVLQIHKVDKDDIHIFIPANLRNEHLQKFGFSGTPHTCDDFDIGRAAKLQHPVQIPGTVNQFHISTTFEK